METIKNVATIVICCFLIINMFPTVEAKWTGVSGEDFAFGVCYLNGYLYTCLNLNPTQVIKIDATTMSTIDKWTGDADEMFCGGITTDGTYIYVSLTSSGFPATVPANVVKIDPTTMTKIGKWTGADLSEASGGDLAYDSPYLYLLVNPSAIHPVKVLRIDPDIMMTIDSWIGDLLMEEYKGKALAISDNHFYVSCHSVPAFVVKVNKSTLVTEGRWEGDISDGGWIEGLVFGLTNDDVYVYAGTYDYLETNPTRLIKIDPATMTTLSKYQGADDEFFSFGLIYYNAQVFMGLYGYPHAMILRINTATMTKEDRWEDVAEDDAIFGFCLNNPKYLYAGINDKPADVLKFELPVPVVVSKSGSSALPLFAKMLIG